MISGSDSKSRKFLTLKRDFLAYLDPGNNEGRYVNAVKIMLRDKTERLSMNLNDLRRHDGNLWEAFLKSPMEHIPPFEEALNDYIKNNSEFQLKAAVRNKTFRLGFDGAFGSRRVDPKNLMSGNITNLMCVEGIVTKVSLVKPKVVRTVHYAESTQQWVNQTYRDGTSFLGAPTSAVYPQATEDGAPLTTEFGLSTYQDHQTVWIQDMPERTTAGTMPRSVECILDKDLVDSCKPGDRVEMIGVYRVLAGKATGEHSGQFKTVMIVTNVKLKTNDTSTSVTGDDVRVIKKVSKNPKIFDIMARSIAPSIYGHEYIKKSLVLMLLGGVEKNLENGTHIRGDINILMVGDPSTAKSQTLRAIMNTAPLAINTTGRGASGVGLTAAVTRDRDSGERRLEAGAMVLADRGIVCIDEFDKMSDADRVAIHEVMEQQTVTIAKAGIHTSLNARCSVIAASNPVYGQYDRSKKPHENIALPDSLLSRFDLLFIVLDKLDTEMDRAISDHVLGLHRGRGEEKENEMYADMEQSDDEMDHDANDIWEKEAQSGVAASMRKKNQEKKSFLKMDFCKKYIAYCKNKSKPKLTDEAVEIMAEEYSQLRDVEQGGTLPITARCFETMIRLSSAHAKLRLSKLITKKDVKEVIKILRFALSSSNTDEDEGDDNDQVDEDVAMGDDDGEEIMGEDRSSQAQRKRREERRKKRGEVSNNNQKKRPAMDSKSQTKIVRKALTAYWKKFGVSEVKVDELIEYMKKQNNDISKKDLIKIVVVLDEQAKAFWVEEEQSIHQI